MTPRLRPLLAVSVVVLLSLSACSTSSSTAATVGDAEITNAELELDIELYTFLAGLSGAPCGSAVQGEDQDSACARLALGNDIREELVKAYAAERDLVLEEDDVTAALTQLEQGLGGAEVLETQLQEAGLARSDLVAIARRLLLFTVVQNAVVAERVDETSLREAYDAQLATFTTIEVAHILVPERSDAERIAGEVTTQSFAKIAKRESQDPGSAESGGSLGTFSEANFQAQFDPDFVAGTFSLEPGEISPPVRTQFGWHVIYLARRDVASFEDVREQLEAAEAGPVFEAWFIERANAVDIEVNPRFGRLEPETLQVLPVRSTAEDPTGPTAGAPVP